MTTILFLKIERDKHCFQIIETDELGQKFLSRETQNAMSSESVSETNDLSKKVERWRRRREEVLKYRYLQLYKAVYNLVEEILEPEVPKSPDELVAELEDRAFEGWTLKWERTQLTCRHVGKLSQRDLRKVFAGKTGNYHFVFLFKLKFKNSSGSTDWIVTISSLPPQTCLSLYSETN